MTIIYLSLESFWYIWPHTRISLCILGYICIFISNFFFSLLCDRVTVLKIIWLIILTTLSLLMCLILIFISFYPHYFFLEMCESITHGLIYLGRGRSLQGPKERGWGKVVFSAPQDRAGIGKGNNHEGRGQRSHLLAHHSSLPSL